MSIYPYKDHYTFEGWYTNTIGSGTAWEYGTSGTAVTDNLTLYATWEIDHYDITFDTTYAVSPISGQTIDYGDYITKPSPDPISSLYSGQTFKYWSLSSGEAGAEKFQFVTTLVEEDTELYPYWNTIFILISFEAYEGAPIPSSQLIGINTSVENPDTVVLAGSGTAPIAQWDGTETWYSQAWYDNAEFSGSAILFEKDGVGTADTFTSGQTLYIKLEPVYTLTYDGDGYTAGDIPIDSDTYVSGQTVTIYDEWSS